MRTVALLLAVTLALAGCVSKDKAETAAPTPADPTPSPTPMMTPTAHTNTTGKTTNQTATNATGSSSSNATASDMPSNPGACMEGMDMPGCTMAQYENYKKQQAALIAQRPPDKTLPPVEIAFDPQGAQAPASVTIDAGATTLLVMINVTDTGQGPWLYSGKGGNTDVAVVFTPPAGDATRTTLEGTQAQVGVDPAKIAAQSFTTTIKRPASGAWTVALEGQGQNAKVTISVVERFY